jgi:carbon-monoxide dehydrogenase large subunit
MTTRLIGESVQRREDVPLVTGAGQFLDDVEPPNCVHAAVVRSRLAHARIRDIDVEAAMDVPGVIAIYTHEDLGELDRPLPLGIPNPGLHHPRTQLPLARDETFFVGQPIALVIATDRSIAEDVAERVEVDYEPLPVVADVHAAQRAEALVHHDVPGNLAAELSETVGDPAAAFRRAPHVLERRLWVERGAAMPLETRGVVAEWRRATGELTVWDSTQSPNTVRLGLAGFFKLREHSVEVIAPDVGGGFGVKIAYFYPEELLVPFAAIRLERPVKWVEDRREHFIGSHHERGQLHEARVAFDDEGRILAMEDRFLQDSGSFVPYGVIVPLVTMARLPGPYKVPAFHFESRILYTNTVPVTPYRGAGQPEAVFIAERLMDGIAEQLDLDRAEVRRRNFIQPEDFPYEPGTTDEDGHPTTYDSGNLPAVLEKCLELVRVEDLQRDREDAARRGVRLGFGLAAYVEITGGELYEGARVAVQPSGRVFVTTGIGTQGQGHKTILAQVAAETLGVSMDDVEVVTGDTRQFKWATGTFASRIGVIGGNAVANATEKVRQKVLKLAASVLEAAEEDLSIEEGRVFVEGSPEPSVSLMELAVLANPLRVAYDEKALAASQFAAKPVPAMELLEEPGLEASGYFAPSKPAYANGCHAAVVEVDPVTYEIRILRYAAVHDCGKVINPMLVKGQMLGGIAQGIGGSFYEKLHYDDEGQLVNANFADYLIPYTTEMPHVEVGHVETPSPLNPLGLKGAGEAGVMPPAAVVAGAIEDALGIPIDEAPLSPSRLFELARANADGAGRRGAA